MKQKLLFVFLATNSMSSSSPRLSPLRPNSGQIFSKSTRKSMKKRGLLSERKKQAISPTIAATNRHENNIRLTKVLSFLKNVFTDVIKRPETKEQLADALPNGELLLEIAQYVCRCCNLSCFEFPRLARVTPSGKSRRATQNHAQFVSFCNEINVVNVPSLNDIAEKRVDVVVNVILDIEQYVQLNHTSTSPKILSMNLEEYLTPSKSKNKQQERDSMDSSDIHLLEMSGPSPMLSSIARDATKSSGLLKCLRPSFGGNINNNAEEDKESLKHTKTKFQTPSYLITAIEPPHTSPSSALNLDTSMLASLNSIGKLRHQQQENNMTASNHNNSTSNSNNSTDSPTPNLQNPDTLRHVAKISSSRKRLLDQKDKMIVSLKSTASNLAMSNKKMEEEIKEHKKREKELIKNNDETRLEINLQARAFDENASITNKLRMEVTTLRATITTMETTNTKKEIELQTIMETNKDMNAKMIDITSSTNENSKRLEVAHVAEQKQYQRTIEQLTEDLKSAEECNEKKDLQIVALRTEVLKYRKEEEEKSFQLSELNTNTEEMKIRENKLQVKNDTLTKTLLETENKLDLSRLETKTVLENASAQLAKHEQSQRWFADASSKLRFKLKRVSEAGRLVGDEVRTQITTFSIDFANLSKQIVNSVEQLTSLKSKAVEEYRREQRSRQKTFNELQRLRGNIRVLCRTRPSKSLASKEQETGSYGTTTFNTEEEITVKNQAKKARSANARCYQDFTFDHVFHPSSSQSDVYYEVSPMVQSAMDGFHSCIFAYGQTGSGKTYTMQGPSDDPGVYTRALHELFAVVDQREQTHNYTMKVSMVEIYNETIRDLLSEDNGSQSSKASKKKRNVKKGLEIKKTEHGNEVIGAEVLPCTCPNDIHYIMSRGSKNRSTHGTKANEHSSRSHCLLLIYIEGTELQKGITMRGKLVMVDLAGSERISKTDASGARLKEAQHINKSLSALGNVINALKGKSNHVPFRDSKLTYLLQDSLSKDNKALMITQISPTEKDVEETMCTLQFAQRVKGVELGTAKSHTKTSQTGKMLEMKKTMTRMRVDINGYKTELEKKNQELSNVTNQKISMEEKNNEISNIQEQVQTLKSTITSQSNQVQHMTSELSKMQKEKDILNNELQQSSQQMETYKMKCKTMAREHVTLTNALEHEKERKERDTRRKGREREDEQQESQTEFIKLEAKINLLQMTLMKKEKQVIQLNQETNKLSMQLTQNEKTHKIEMKKRVLAERKRTEAAQKESEDSLLRAEKSERLRLKSKREIVKLKDQLDTHGGRVTSNHHSRRKSKEQGSVERERFAERAAAASRRASVLSLEKTKQKENTQEQREIDIEESNRVIQERKAMIEAKRVKRMSLSINTTTKNTFAKESYEGRRVSYSSSPIASTQEKQLSIIIDQEEDEDEHVNNEKEINNENIKNEVIVEEEEEENVIEAFSFMDDEDMELDSSTGALDLSAIERRCSRNSISSQSRSSLQAQGDDAHGEVGKYEVQRSSRRSSRSRRDRNSTSSTSSSSMELDISITSTTNDNTNEHTSTTTSTTPKGVQPSSATTTTTPRNNNNNTPRSTSRSTSRNTSRSTYNTTPRSVSNRNVRTPSSISSNGSSRGHVQILSNSKSTPKHTPSKDIHHKAEKGILKKKPEMTRMQQLVLYRRNKKKMGTNATNVLSPRNSNHRSSTNVKKGRVTFQGVNNANSPIKSPLRGNSHKLKSAGASSTSSRYRKQPSTPHNRISNRSLNTEDENGEEKPVVTKPIKKSSNKLLSKFAKLGGAKRSGSSRRSTRSAKTPIGGTGASRVSSRSKSRSGWN